MENILDDNFEKQSTAIDTNIDEQVINSTNKFILLSVLTLGIYQLWWIYKEWRFFKQKNMPDITPAARAIFSIFFLNSLMSRILQFAKEKGYSENYSSTTLFVFYILFTFLGRLPDPYWLVSVFSFVFLLPPYKAMTYAKLNSPDLIVKEQNTFSGRQILLVVLGLIFWGLIIFGLKESNSYN